MFTDDILLRGKHATYTKRLAPRDIEENNNMKAFNRYIDVLMVGAVIGFITGKKEKTDRESEYKDDDARIFLNAIQNNHDSIDVVFRTIMLLDKVNDETEEDRINRAFRDDLNREFNDNHKKNKELFLDYARGGITYLYNKIFQDAVNQDDIISNINDFVADFNDEYILDKYADGEIDYESDIT